MQGNAADDQKPKPKRFLGGYAEGVTPVPIPNTEVKPLWADGTARAAVWESRSPPGILLKKLHLHRGGAFLCSLDYFLLDRLFWCYLLLGRLLRPCFSQ